MMQALHEDPAVAAKLQDARRFVQRRYVPRKPAPGMDVGDYDAALNLALWEAGRRWDPRQGKRTLFNFAVTGGERAVKRAEQKFGPMTSGVHARFRLGETLPPAAQAPLSLDQLMEFPDESDEERDFLPSEEPGPEEMCIRWAEAEELWQAVGGLKEPQQSVILLYYREGLTDAEIGLRQGRHPHAVQGIRHRALKVLREFAGVAA